jgi:hypothetical protein
MRRDGKPKRAGRAGHFSMLNQPRTQGCFDTFEMGGTPLATAQAARQAWSEVLAFLERRAV